MFSWAANMLPHRMKKARLSAMMHSSGLLQSLEVQALVGVDVRSFVVRSFVIVDTTDGTVIKSFH